MNKKILHRFNMSAIVVCLIFYVFTRTFTIHAELNSTFLIASAILIMNALLIQHERYIAASVLFLLVANTLLILFDMGITGDTRTFIFYIPLLLCPFVFVDLKHKNIRYAMVSLTLLCIIAVNIKGLTPRWAYLLINPEYVVFSTYFNVILGVATTFILFNILINSYLRTQRLLYKEEERLKKSQDFIRSINQNIDVGICRTHAELDKLIYVNRAQLELFGYDSESDMLAMHPSAMYVKPSDREYIIEQLKDAGSVKNFEVELKRKDGSHFWGLLTTSKYVDEDGFTMYDGVVRDITEIKKIGEALTLAKEAAEQASVAKSKFLSAMSHEIRTPMNAVIGITDLLLMGDSNKDVEIRNLNVLKNSAQNLMRLLNNTLDFTKIEAGKMELILKPERLADVVNEVAAIYAGLAADKQLDLRIQVSTTTQRVWMDKIRVQQVLSNLLSNAIKFTTTGHVIIQVEILSVSQTHCKVLFAVQDTGVGIDSFMQQSVFDAFRQEQFERSTDYGGSGLGLAISRKIVEMMGATFTLQSERNKGSKFSFELELKLADIAELPEQQAAASTPVLDRVAVLLVEDTPVNVLVARQILAKWKCTVHTAANGQEAIQIVKSGVHIDIILMDLHMPVLDGIKATRMLRDMGVAIPILALTADALTETRNECIRVGMNDYITKPFNPKDLQQKISKYTGQQRLI